jgi:flagellar hook-associated protein 2
MSITPLVFTGISNFSDDFQLILDRAVGIASLPVQQMQTEQADLLTRKTLLGGLGAAVESLGGSVAGLGSIGEHKALSVSSSNTSKVTATLNGATAAGSYTISDITSVARVASETTSSGYATPDETAVSADGVLELLVGSATYEIDLTGEGRNNLEGLRDAINGLGAGVTATVLNTGTGETPYYLSITAVSTGEQALQLRETPGEPASNLLTAANQGANAVFRLNGLQVESAENVLAGLIPGVTLGIVGETEAGEEVEIRLATSRTNLSSALSQFAALYNAVADQVNAQIGEEAGLLSGEWIVREVQKNLRALTTYRTDGQIAGLTDLGIEIDSQGVMSFNSATFNALPDSAIASAFDFLGSETSGWGGLSSSFSQLTDPVSGLIQTQQSQYDEADARLERQIEEISERIQFMQHTLSEKLQLADSLLAQLEAQQSLLDASIRGLNLALYGRNEE